MKIISCIMGQLQSLIPITGRRELLMKTSRGLLSISTLVACLFVLAGLAAGQQPLRGITPEDYVSFEFISDPHVSPDGKLVAYVVTKVDRAQNRRNSAIWMASI